MACTLSSLPCGKIKDLIKLKQNVKSCIYSLYAYHIVINNSCFWNVLGGSGAKGEKGIQGPPGPRGSKGETITIVEEITATPAPQIIEDSEICVDVEIVFHEAPKPNCILSSEIIKKAIAEAIGTPENHFENVLSNIITGKDQSRQLKVTFTTTKSAERVIKQRKANIKLPLDKAKCP